MVFLVNLDRYIIINFNGAYTFSNNFYHLSANVVDSNTFAFYYFISTKIGKQLLPHPTLKKKVHNIQISEDKDHITRLLSVLTKKTTAAVFRWSEKEMRKVTSNTVAYCSTFRLFVVIVVLP